MIYLLRSVYIQNETFNPIWPGLLKDIVDQGGHDDPTCFFSFWDTKSQKLNLGTFLVLKTTWKAILDNSRFLSLAAKGPQISMDITVEKFKISKILSFNGVMHLK